MDRRASSSEDSSSSTAARTRAPTAVLTVFLCLGATACGAHVSPASVKPPSTRTASARTASAKTVSATTAARVEVPLRVATLTNDGADGYATTSDEVNGRVHVAALPANTGGNDRRIVWSPRGEPTVDGESCARWPFEDGREQVSLNIQQGAALRVRTNADGSVDALTVTRNVWARAYWGFNVHQWHAIAGRATYEILAAFPLPQLVGPGGLPASLPWYLCARVVGAQLSFVVWLDGERRPAYGTPGRGGTVTLPAADVHPGYFGWYVGHLIAGQTADFDGLVPPP